MKGKILLVGDILVDVSLKTKSQKSKLRFGGVIHAARYLWSAGIEYDVAYFAPSYLDQSIAKFLENLHCNKSFKLGEVTGAPYVMLIEEVKEIGDQGYEFLLRDEVEIKYCKEGLSEIGGYHYSDALFISGNYVIADIISGIHVEKCHLDLANNVNSVSEIDLSGNKLNTLFLSTSSGLFKEQYKNDFIQFAELFRSHSERIILKENRGGSRLYNFSSGNSIKGFAQIQQIVHSVGVGDVFDISFIQNKITHTEEESLTLASWISAEYASTTFPDDFKDGISRILNSSIERMIVMKGISVPWENRSDINIYIAAPDFPFVDTSEIEIICNSLKYHNFSPRRPIQENGLMEKDATFARKQELFTKDMQLLNNCSILLAVLLYDDPGTLIEIGIAAEKGIPTIVYDPYGKSNNCFLTQIPNLISSDRDKILCEIFIQADRLINDKI